MLDSATKFKEYVDLAILNGQKAIASTEHGLPRGWISKKLCCDEQGVKFIHGVEIYLTESLETKVRDNYHTVLLAKNYDGVKELNKLVTLSSNRDHFYYTNRISFDEFLNISPNIITTSACLASPLNHIAEDNPYFEKLIQRYDYLEVQPHDHPDQIVFNKKLYGLSQKYNKPLIAGTDTHSSSQYKAECREILLEAKHKSYTDDTFDLSYKTYDELVEMFRKQNALPEDVYLQAIENTNVMADSVEEFELDKSIKYPVLYGSPEADNEKFSDTVEELFKEKCDNNVIPQEQREAFRSAIDEEMRVFRKLDMCGFMLTQSELVRYCKQNGMVIGPGRGSVCGSRVAYVTDITDVNPEKWHTVFSRFCNENRVEPGDIDTDCTEEDRPKIFQYIIDRFGADKTARVAAYGTLQEKGVIDDVGRALALRWKNEHEGASDEANPWSLPKIVRIKKEYDADKEATIKRYPELFYYMEGLAGVRISQSIHPAGMVISPITLDENYGVFDKDGERCLMLDMDEAHAVGCVKYDFLILKTLNVIRDTCAFLGVPYPKMHEIDWDDKDVWADMRKDLTTVFQMESPYAQKSFRRYQADSIFDMAIVTACIRPSGASYRDRLLNRIPHQNPSAEMDELLKDNLGYLVFQEDTLKILQQICGLSGSDADTVRRAIGHKDKETIDKALPQIIDGYCQYSEKPRETAEKEAKEIVQIIEDSASYQFGLNHAIAYCMVGYLCGYYRYHYPYEYLTAFLNNAANDADIANGTAYAHKIGISVTMPKWGISRSDYFYNKDKHIIAKGMSSIKYLSPTTANQLYNLSANYKYDYFVDILHDIVYKTDCDARNIDTLLKIGFFSNYGNDRELGKIKDTFFDVFNRGMSKQIRRDKVDGTWLESIVKYNSMCSTKSGKPAVSYTIIDMESLLHDMEIAVKQQGIQDLPLRDKIMNCYDVMGYFSYMSGKEEDRRKIFVLSERSIDSKKHKDLFAHAVRGKSIGSGKESEYTIYNDLYRKNPVKKGDMIYVNSVEKNTRGYWVITSYRKIME